MLFNLGHQFLSCVLQKAILWVHNESTWNAVNCPSHLCGQLLAFWVFVEGIPRTPAKRPCVLLVDSFPVFIDSLVSHTVTSQSRVIQAVFV